MAQQLREATPFGEGPRFLIRDNDAKFGDAFDRVAGGNGIEGLPTPCQAPKADAICERFLGSVRRESLDFFLILSERHLSNDEAVSGLFQLGPAALGHEPAHPLPARTVGGASNQGRDRFSASSRWLASGLSAARIGQALTSSRCLSVRGGIHSRHRGCPTQVHTTRVRLPKDLGRLEAYSRADVDWHLGDRVCQTVSDRPFCCTCAGTTGLKWAKLVN
jgi:hypothetical protein